ncbi:hypothetical protein H0H93_014538 [Arthromyces matolae]|nr:hypothetical protein H0H93_014538 [Arthromyces matolae]
MGIDKIADLPNGSGQPPEVDPQIFVGAIRIDLDNSHLVSRMSAQATQPADGANQSGDAPMSPLSPLTPEPPELPATADLVASLPIETPVPGVEINHKADLCGQSASGDVIKAADYDRVGGNHYLRKARDGSGYLLFYGNDDYFVDVLPNSFMKECLIYNAKLWNKGPRPGMKVPIGYIAVANVINKDPDCPWGFVAWDDDYSEWIAPPGKVMPGDKDITVNAPSDGDLAAYARFIEDFVDKRTREFNEAVYDRFKACFTEVEDLSFENSRLNREKRILERERDSLKEELIRLKKRKRFASVYDEDDARSMKSSRSDYGDGGSRGPSSARAGSAGPSGIRR